MKSISAFARSLVLLSLLATASAEATVLLSTSGGVSASGPTQMGRLSRNAIPQDWTGGEPFPGIVNPAIAYHYTTFLINVGITPFIQIEFDSVSANTFISVYQTSYMPNSSTTGNLGFDTNWLGDAGSSGNYFGVDPLFFQVTAALNSTIVVVINNTGAGNLGTGDPFGGLIVDGFIDTMYTDAPTVAAVPEPSTIALSLVGFIGIAALRRRKARQGFSSGVALAA